MDCADVLIGNEAESIKGISGGEKRRLSVGIELVTHPSLILMDEPTSGLDSEIALTIMTMLRNLASKGRTVRVPLTFLLDQGSYQRVSVLLRIFFIVVQSRVVL